MGDSKEKKMRILFSALTYIQAPGTAKRAKY
jgi:hypothetical protein